MLDMLRHSLKRKMTRLMNQTGVPFQEWCAEIVSRTGYSCAVEIPFTWPPAQGPLTGTPGSIDIVAVAANMGNADHPALFGKGITYLVVECKRAHSRIKNWVFPASSVSPSERALFLSRHFDRRGAGHDVAASDVAFPRLGYESPSSFDSILQGFEFNDGFDALNRNQEERMYKYLRQVNTGLKAFTERRLSLPGLVSSIDPPYALYLPVLVTTASLYMFRYRPGEVRVPHGELDFKHAEFEERPWITYHFPLPDSLVYCDGLIEKMPTFIVNAMHWESFLKNVVPVFKGNAGTHVDS